MTDDELDAHLAREEQDRERRWLTVFAVIGASLVCAGVAIVAHGLAVAIDRACS